MMEFIAPIAIIAFVVSFYNMLAISKLRHEKNMDLIDLKSKLDDRMFGLKEDINTVDAGFARLQRRIEKLEKKSCLAKNQKFDV